MTGHLRAPQASVRPGGLELISASGGDVAATRPPLLFVHGVGHGAWCWENWQHAAAAAGWDSWAVSLRGHAGSGGALRTATVGRYADDVVRVAASLPRRAVLVGHSMGALVVQQALARYGAAGAVMVAPVPAHPAVGSLLAILRRHPGDAVRMMVGRSLPLRPEYLFAQLDGADAQRQSARCGPESPLAQLQLLLHRPAPAVRGNAPVLVLATPDDALVPITDVRRTARRYGAEVAEFPGMGHDLMLDRDWQLPMQRMLAWLEDTVSR